MSRRVEVDSASDAPAQARRFARAQLAELLADVPGLGETVDDVELLVSELISNAAKASAAPITLTLEVHRDWLGLTVHDDDPGKPVILHPEPGDVHGRGLRIVSVLAQDWGVQPDPDGKTVWVRLPLPAGAAADLTCTHPTDLDPTDLDPTEQERAELERAELERAGRSGPRRDSGPARGRSG